MLEEVVVDEVNAVLKNHNEQQKFILRFFNKKYEAISDIPNNINNINNMNINNIMIELHIC